MKDSKHDDLLNMLIKEHPKVPTYLLNMAVEAYIQDPAKFHGMYRVEMKKQKKQDNTEGDNVYKWTGGSTLEGAITKLGKEEGDRLYEAACKAGTADEGAQIIYIYNIKLRIWN